MPSVLWVNTSLIEGRSRVASHMREVFIRRHPWALYTDLESASIGSPLHHGYGKLGGRPDPESAPRVLCLHQHHGVYMCSRLGTGQNDKLRCRCCCRGFCSQGQHDSLTTECGSPSPMLQICRLISWLVNAMNI